MEVGQKEQLDRRRFLKRAGTIAWSAPVIYSLLSEQAFAQSISCGTAPGLGTNDMCPTPDGCPSTRPNCCHTNATTACVCLNTTTAQRGCV